ncbi:MAG: hypothetical protein HY769_00940, partial [Candidatus Stahlbacteria bacterium]|nr:hypothetical protein [Candidatus Stahlbacteria bacterium]
MKKGGEMGKFLRAMLCIAMGATVMGLHKAEASQSVVANAVSPEGGGIVPSKDAKAVIH